MKINFTSLSIALCIALCVTCKSDQSENQENTTYFGGEIVNPNSKYIVLSKSGKIIDTLKLNAKNRFGCHLKLAEPSLYSFYDTKEYQTFLLKPKDSLLLRLNTMDFDHSLVYTGLGAKENNFLMNLFLENENENKALLSLCQLAPKAFEDKLNELKQKKDKKLETFKTKHKTSALFNKIAKANIDFKHFTSKEFYPFANYEKSEIDVLKSLPDDFYDYRNQLDLNDPDLKNYKPYTSFIRFYINNLALKEYAKQSKNKQYNTNSLDYNLIKLNLIDSKIENPDIKNDLLYYTITRYVSLSNQPETYSALFDSFKSKCTKKEFIERTSKIVETYKRLKPGLKIPDVTLLDTNEKPIALQSLIKRPTVIYFWSKQIKNHLTQAHKRAKQLQNNYPELDFIAISVDSMNYEQQHNILKRNKLDLKNEYRFQTPSTAKDILSIDPIINAFIIDKNKNIVNPKANIFNISFEQELLGLLNQ